VIYPMESKIGVNIRLQGNVTSIPNTPENSELAVWKRSKYIA
jgi:hypothetical protein